MYKKASLCFFFMVALFKSGILNASSTSLDLLRQESIKSYLDGVDLIGPELEANVWIHMASTLLDIFENPDKLAALPQVEQDEMRALLYDNKDIKEVHQKMVGLYHQENQEILNFSFSGSANLSQFEREEQLHEEIKKSMELVAKGLTNLEEANLYKEEERRIITGQLVKQTCCSCGLLLPCMIYYLVHNYCYPCSSLKNKAWRNTIIVTKELRTLLRSWNEDYEKISFSDLQVLIRESTKFPKPIVLLVESFLAHDKFLGLSDIKLKSFKRAIEL